MVTHVLVDETALDVDCLVVLQQLLYFSELLQGFMETLCATVHETEMEHGGDECSVVLEGELEVVDRMLNQFFFLLAIFRGRGRICLAC